MNINQIVEILETDIENVKASFDSENCSFCADHAPKVVRNKIIINSLKKQDPIKVMSIAYDDSLNIISGICPSCSHSIEYRLTRKIKTWCDNCGQALGWRM